MYILLSTDFEADLQEVWSVRKNIHHTGQILPRAVSSSVQVTAAGGQYSRHGAIPAQQSMQGHQALGTKDSLIKGVCSSHVPRFLFGCIMSEKSFADIMCPRNWKEPQNEAMYIVHVHTGAASPVRLVWPWPDHFLAGHWSRSQTVETV